MNTHFSQKYPAGKLRLWRGFAFSLVMTLGLVSIIATGGGNGDDTPQHGTIALASATYTATEGTDGTITITVTRTGGSAGAASVDYATSNDTATAPGDYTAASGTLNWADGDSAGKTFDVTIQNDSDVEGAESFNVTLSNVTVAALGSPSSATVTINDDDVSPGVLQLSSLTYSVTEGTDATVTITVTRTLGSAGAVSVDYATIDNTAMEPGDYIATTGTLSWADGETASKTFVITIVDDLTPESAEQFGVNLSNVVGATLGTNISAAVDIADDDNPGTLQLDPGSYSVTEGVDQSVTITVTRTGGDSGPASVDYTTADSTATEPGDYTATSGTLNWADGDAASKTFNVPIIDDSTAEVIESFVVNLSNVSGATLGNNNSATVTITDNDLITGKVSAPSGVLALRQPGILERMFATVFGKNLKAAIIDLVVPVPNVSVNLYEVDANGDVVGIPLDSAVTDTNGDYILQNPPVDAPALKYIVRAESGVTMDSRVTSMQVDVDPTTDATSKLVATIATDLADLSITEVQEIQEDVGELIPFIDTTGSPTSTQLSDRLQAQALRMSGQYNVLYSKVSGGEICGTVQSPGGSPLANVDIIVRQFDDWEQRARTVTDANGDYCVNVPIQGVTDPDGGTFDGEYILGAFNRNDDSGDAERSASEWYSAGGASFSRFDADMVSVTSATTVSGIDLQLALGARFTGTVTASGSSAPLEGVSVVLSDFDSGLGMASARVEPDGSYRVNVIPGTYLAEVQNSTRAAYASEFYDGATGSTIYSEGIPVTVAAGDEETINFVLEAGSQLTGTITDGATSNPVMRAGVRIDVEGDANAETENTDREGYYHIWLRPASYSVYAYGQSAVANLTTPGTTAVVDFAASVSRIEGVVQDGGNNPVVRAKMRLYDSSFNFMGQEVSDSNGVFTLYTALTGDHYLEIRIDREHTVGSIIYNNQTQLLSGTAIVIASVGDDQTLSPIALPDGGMLRGNVYADYTDANTNTPWPNFRVQVRDGGVLVDNRFLQLRTRGDGSYVISLPATTYDRVKMRDATDAATGNGNCNDVPVVAASTTVLNYINDTNTCELNP